MPAPKFRMRGTTSASETEATQKKTSTAPKFRMRGAGGGTSPSLPTATSQTAGETTGKKKAGRPTAGGKLSKITSPEREAESRAEELRTLRDEAHQEFLNFRGAEITAGATGMPTEPYAGQRYRTAEEAYQAWQDYDRQYAEFRNQYYQEENERQQARLAGDTAMQASFARADEIRAALNRIQSLEQTRAAAPGPMTEDAVSQALQELVGQYGLSQEDGRDLTTARKALEAQLLDETDRLSAAGYDYERMAEYQRRQQTAAEAERQRQQTEAWAEEHPVLASIASVAAAPLQAIDIPRLIASGGGNEDDLRTYTPADPSSALVTGFVTTVRDTVSKQIEENTDWDLFGQNVASFLYNTGLSVGDSALQVGLLGPWATYLMGASAASQQAVNVLERGGSNTQAFWGGLAAGAAEAVFEKFSVDRLLRARNVNSVKDLLRETAKQAGTEASEEMLTEVANILSDTAVMGQSSDFEQLVTQYQLMGMGEDEARKQAYLDSLSQVVWAGVGGALSGAAMGGATSGVDLAGRNIRQGIRDYQTSPIDDAYAVMQKDGMFSPYARAAVQEADRRRGVTEAVDRAAWMTDRWNRKARRDYLRNRGSAQGEQELPTVSQQAQSSQDTQALPQQAQITQALPAGTQNAAQEGAAQVRQGQGQPAEQQTQNTPAADPVIQTLESGDRVDQAALSNEQFEALAERGDMDVDAGGRVYRVDPAQHIDQRSSEDMGDRKINAFQFDHPEVHQYYSEAAAELLDELSLTEKGGQTIRLGDYQTGYEYRRTSRAAPERIAALLDDYGLSYDQIEKALDAIIHNHGQENIAAAKRVEFVLDDMLTNGYQSMNGYIPPNQEYIKAKASIAGYVEPTEGGSGYLDGIDEVPMTAERTKQNGQQEAEPGDGVSDGDLGRLSGTGAGEQAGGMGTGTERGRGPTDTFRTARERQNSVHHLRGEQISSRDLGLLRGTDAKTIRIVPESAWDDSLRATADRVRNETGLDTVFVIGGIQIESPDGARLARGVYTADRIIVQADNIRVTPDQIADHEIFHDRAAQTPGLVRELEDRVREQYGPEELGRVVEQYIRKLRGVIDITENAGDDGTQAEAWDILEEIFADAYAGINAFSAHAERFNETVEQTMADRGVGRGGQNAAATDRTTGPPAEGRYSFGGENARRANLDALDQAKEMERQGVAMETIFRETGWYTGADGKWRFEIDDSGMEYSRWGDMNRSDRAEYARFRELEGRFIDGTITQEEQTELRTLLEEGHGPGRAEEQQTLRLSDFVRHDELYQNYPQLRQAGLRFADLPGETHGSYNTGTNTITLNSSLRDAPEDTLVHEIQHAIQNAEGFAGGSSPEYWERARIDAETAASAARENLRLWLQDIGYQDYVRQSMDRVVAGEITLDQHWENLQRFKENSDRAREIAVSEEEVARYEERLREIDQMGMTARALYQNTAGEIEARDVTARRQLTPEQRRQTMPNTGDENTVFADNFGNSFSAEAAEPVDSQAFKDWFGDWTSDRADHSQVVDGQGRPLIVYHGTGTSIEEFLPEFTGQGNDQYGSGFYFTTDRETAEGYTTRTLNDQSKPGGMDNPNVIPAYLNIRNPLVVEARDTPNLYQIEVPASQAAKIIGKMPDIMDPENSILGDFFDDYWESGPKRSMINRLAREYDWTLGTLATDIFRDHPTEYRQAVRDVLGYDGVQVNFPSGEKHFIAWFPNQIKHATENSGAFSPNDNRIRYSISEPTDTQQDEADRLFFQGVDADTIREMTGLERTEDGDWRIAVDTAPTAAYDGGRTTEQQGGTDNGQDTTLRGIYGEDVRGEIEEVYPGRAGRSGTGDARGSTADEGRGRTAPASWARGRVIDQPSTAAGIAAENAGRYGTATFVVDDAAIKERNPNAWALTSGGHIYISDSIPAELASVVGFHETVHAAKQKENPQYLNILENSDDYINYQNDRAKQVLDVVLQARFPGKNLVDLSQDQMNTIFDELNAVVWGYYKADPENAREQFADMFQDYDAYIADLDAAMESGATADGDVRYSMDEDAAAEPPDNPLPSPDQERRSDMFRPAGMSDEQYNRLNEQWKSRPAAQRAEPGAVPEGFDSIDDYTAALEAAAEERMRNRSREEFEGSDTLKNLGIRIANSVGLYGNTQQLIENDRAAKSVRKEIKRAERRLQATDAEKNFASGVAAGIYGEADIPPSMDADTVMELADYYWAEKAVQNDLIREQRTKINRNLDERVRRLMDGVDDAKTKVPAAVIMRNRTPERNMRRIFGNAKGDEINDYLFRPVQDNEAERIRFVNRMHNEVRTFLDRDGKNRGLNQEERALVQLVIEGRAAEDAVNAMERSRDIQNAAENIKNARKLAGKDDLVKRRQAEIDASVDEAREFNLGTDERRLAIQYSRWLETRERLEGADTTIIGNAVEKYRDLFNQLYDAANDFLVAHGYEPIGFIRGYAPHLQSQETQDRFSSALERMGINREIGKLPTSIAGRTRNFRPNMPWNRFFKHRDSQGEFADPDIAEGFEKYVDSMSDVLYHTDDIMRTRAFVRYFRRTYAPEEIRNQLEQADALRYAPADQQASFLRDQGRLSYTSAPTYEDVHQTMEQYVDEQYQAIESLTLYGDLAIFLDDYANNLANKQLFEDRAMEKSFGRTTLNAASKLHRAFTRAQVSANLSSALNQGGQLPIILAENGTQNVARALLDLRSKDLKSWAAGSDFLTEKKGINYIVTGFGDRAINAAFKPLEFVDGIVSTLAVRSRYLKEVRAGKSAAEAMRLADRFGREVMASRAKGSTPLAFRSKDFISQMVHMFQLEALNNWEHVTQDLGNRDFREMAQAKGKRAAAGSLAAILVKIVLGAFLLNRIDEELYGGTPAPFDILGLAGNFVAGGLGLTQMDLLQTLVDNGWERLTGERLFGTDAELNEFDAAAGWDDFVWNGLNEIPFASNVAALAGMGDRTLPMPDLSNLTSLPGTIAEDGLFSWEVARQLAGLAGDVLPGGRQIEKSIQGGEALLRGGYYRGSGENRRLQFPVEQDFWNILRGMLFGRSTLEESQAFYASGQTGLSANQTKAYEQIVDMGADPQTVYQAIQGWRAAENDEDLTSYGRNVAKRDAITEADLTDEQKLALYRGLSDADSGTPDHFQEMMDTGLSWDQVMEAYDQYQFLNSDEDTPEAERLSASEKATEFASWVEQQNYTEDQAETVKEALRYWQMIPAEASQKVLVADEYGISNRSRNAVSDEIDRLKGDGNSVTQDLAEEAIQNVPGLSNRERAVLWQIQNKSWKWNKNPFDKRVGREVYDRMREEDEE